MALEIFWMQAMMLKAILANSSANKQKKTEDTRIPFFNKNRVNSGNKLDAGNSIRMQSRCNGNDVSATLMTVMVGLTLSWWA